MKTEDINKWALDVIEQVKAGQPHEDSIVELKAEWPVEANKTARQLAGHANAAGGHPILWLIGVDEKTGVVGVPDNELSNWLPRIKAEFDEVAPSMTDLNVPFGEATVVALVFETDWAPYVVKNEKYGTVNGGAVQWEVPWREGRSTRAATRRDLLRMVSSMRSAAELRKKYTEFCARMELEWSRLEKIDPFDRTSATAVMERTCSGLLDFVAMLPSDVRRPVRQSIKKATDQILSLQVELVRHDKLAGELPNDFWNRGKQLLKRIESTSQRIS